MGFFAQPYLLDAVAFQIVTDSNTDIQTNHLLIISIMSKSICIILRYFRNVNTNFSEFSKFIFTTLRNCDNLKLQFRKE